MSDVDENEMSWGEWLIKETNSTVDCGRLNGRHTQCLIVEETVEYWLYRSYRWGFTSILRLAIKLIQSDHNNSNWRITNYWIVSLSMAYNSFGNDLSPRAMVGGSRGSTGFARTHQSWLAVDEWARPTFIIIFAGLSTHCPLGIGELPNTQSVPLHLILYLFVLVCLVVSILCFDLLFIVFPLWYSPLSTTTAYATNFLSPLYCPIGLSCCILFQLVVVCLSTLSITSMHLFLHLHVSLTCSCCNSLAGIVSAKIFTHSSSDFHTKLS
jgi:hypothetical protein